MVTIVLSVSYALRNHENFLKMEPKNFTLGGFCPRGCPRTDSVKMPKHDFQQFSWPNISETLEIIAPSF